MSTLRELTHKRELIAPGHRLCAGCAEPIAIRQVLLAAPSNVVVANATGCVEVSTTVYPYTSWRCSWIHSAFENVAATICGVESAYKSLKKQGKITENYNFIAFAGDGGTYDIGLQSLSGALERGHKFLYVCLDNQAYMNTGIQRSSATPKYSWTTTSPIGNVVPGKAQNRKDLTSIVASHNIPYVAQASPSFWHDLMKKVQKALSADGPSFINILTPCPRGWRFDGKKTIEIGRLAVETCVWPLFEVENGNWKLTFNPQDKKDPVEWLKSQDRFRHFFLKNNEKLIEDFKENVAHEWNKLLKKCNEI